MDQQGCLVNVRVMSPGEAGWAIYDGETIAWMALALSALSVVDGIRFMYNSLGFSTQHCVCVC
jgi:hypothetical protein